MKLIEHFTVDELKCSKSGVAQFNDGFLARLEELRVAYGLPMIINSGCRSRAYQQELNPKAPNSYHVYDIKHGGRTGSLAVDVSTKRLSQYQRERLIYTAASMGWSVGFYNTFLHLDRRVDLGHTITCFNGNLEG